MKTLPLILLILMIRVYVGAQNKGLWMKPPAGDTIRYVATPQKTFDSIIIAFTNSSTNFSDTSLSLPVYLAGDTGSFYNGMFVRDNNTIIGIPSSQFVFKAASVDSFNSVFIQAHVLTYYLTRGFSYSVVPLH